MESFGLASPGRLGFRVIVCSKDRSNVSHLQKVLQNKLNWFILHIHRKSCLQL